jgi:hypothetical protein
MFAAADARQDALPMADLVDIQNRGQLHVPDPLDALHVVVQVLVKSVEVLLQVDAIQPGFHRVLLVVVVVVEGLVVDLEGELLDRVQDNLTLELARDSHLPQVAVFQHSVLLQAATLGITLSTTPLTYQKVDVVEAVRHEQTDVVRHSERLQPLLHRVSVETVLRATQRHQPALELFLQLRHEDRLAHDAGAERGHDLLDLGPLLLLIKRTERRDSLFVLFILRLLLGARGLLVVALWCFASGVFVNPFQFLQRFGALRGGVRADVLQHPRRPLYQTYKSITRYSRAPSLRRVRRSVPNK